MPGGHLRYSFIGQAPETVFGDGKGLHSSAATLTDAGDLVTIVGHGLLDGDAIYLTSLVGTTGVSENVAYFVRDRTADTFKLAATSGGAALVLTTDGSATVNRLGTYLGIEGDGFSHFPSAEFAEIERQAGIQEAPEVLDSAYNLEGQERVALYPATAKKIFDFALKRTNGELDSYPLLHHTGLGTGTSQKSVGVKASKVSFTAEKSGGNPAILMSIDTKGQVDNPVANPPLAAIRAVLTEAKSYEITRGFIEPRDDQSTAPAISLIENGLNFTINIDQAVKEDGRAPDIDGSPTDPLAMRNIPTGLSAGVTVVTGSFRTNPTNARFLEMIQQLKAGSLHIMAFHRTSRLVGTEVDIAAGATTVHVPTRALAGSGIFTAASGTEIITSESHGLRNGQKLTVTNTGGALPGGLFAGVTYFVIEKTTDTFKLAATPGGAAINLTSDGTGTQTWAMPGAGGVVANDVLTFRAAGTPNKVEVVTVSSVSATLARAAVAVTVADEIFTFNGHGFANGQAVVLSVIVGITGVATNTSYYVIAATANTFQIALTPGGAAIDIGGVNGTCTVTSASLVLTVKGRGTGGGFRYAWAASGTNIYTVGFELFVPGFRVERGPLGGGRKDNVSQEVTWRADAVAGVEPFMWAVAGSSLYAA